MQESYVIDRIKSICEARSWTYYRLAKESKITYSTLCTMLHKANAPSIPTLIKICKGFGITLSQFFNENDNSICMTDNQVEHLQHWEQLTAENQLAVEKYIQFLLAGQNEPHP